MDFVTAKETSRITDNSLIDSIPQDKFCVTKLHLKGKGLLELLSPILAVTLEEIRAQETDEETSPQKAEIWVGAAVWLQYLFHPNSHFLIEYSWIFSILLKYPSLLCPDKCHNLVCAEFQGLEVERLSNYPSTLEKNWFWNWQAIWF